MTWELGNERKNIGILNLQGDSAKHARVFEKLGVKVLLVKNSDDLAQCDGLVFPGGESSTMRMMIDFSGLTDMLIDFVKNKPVFATCAGVVLLAKNIENEPKTEFANLNICIQRNGWGRQVHSFVAAIEFLKQPFEAVFIRAPKISKLNKTVTVLSTIADEPVLIEQENILAATFHPELTENMAIHQYWLRKYFG